MLTQNRLRQVLNYDPETGVFRFVKGRRKGRTAGTVHDTRGFLKVSIDGRNHLLHRLACLWMTGTMPRWNVEHINGDHGDNRWANLREGERSQKRQYRAPRRQTTTCTGIWKVGTSFEAMVAVQGVTINLGAFETMDKAAAAITLLQRRAQERQATQRRLSA
ncbi:HNH endonuclease [Paracoccus shandongensis]|uniref:HNH endonuclease n=1 Tax=Paracoccus shandongensis TaxID=2816048 RepID=UPI001A8C34F2|nr:HNH endonuclease [Paracoccus shandongensis]